MGKHLTPPGAPPGDGVRPARRRSKLSRIFPWTVLAFVLSFSLAAGLVAIRAKQTNTSMVNVVERIVIPAPESLFGKDRLMVLLVGLDYDWDNKDNESSKNARTDSIRAIALDFKTGSIGLIAVPRDTLVTVNGREEKINQAHADGGIVLAQEVIGSFLGLPKTAAGGYFDRYIALRINATKEVIDAIGGIDVPVKQAMDYDDNWGHLHIHFKRGTHHMSGEQAVSYARFRHDALGDVGRIERQDEVIRITIDKLKHDRLNDLTHINQLAGVLQRQVITNFTTQEEVSIATAFSQVDQRQIKSAQVPYTTDRDTKYAGNVLIADEAAKTKLVAKLLTGPMGPEPTPEAQTIAAIDPAKIAVEVLNGSGQSGIGAKMATALQAKGYVVSHVGNAASYAYDTTEIHTHSSVLGVGDRVRNDVAPLPNVTVVPDPSVTPAPKTDVTVIVGKDFAASAVAAPTTSPMVKRTSALTL